MVCSPEEMVGCNECEQELLDAYHISVIDCTNKADAWILPIKVLWHYLLQHPYVRDLNGRCGGNNLLTRIQELNKVILVPASLMRESRYLPLKPCDDKANPDKTVSIADIERAFTAEDNLSREEPGFWERDEELHIPPEAGCLPYEGKDGRKKASVVVEALGIYVSSLAAWAQHIISRGNISNEIAACIRKFSLCDEPAILLCPSLIYSNSEWITSPTQFSNVQDEDDFDTQKHPFWLLKQVLYHEVGHHVFPLHTTSTYFGELFANWFSYNTIPPWDQKMLELFSTKQSYEYRQYTSLLHLQCANAFAEPWLIQPFSENRMVVDIIEGMAFKDKLDTKRGHMGQWKTDINNSLLCRCDPHNLYSSLCSFVLNDAVMQKAFKRIFDNYELTYVFRSWVFICKLLMMGQKNTQADNIKKSFVDSVEATLDTWYCLGLVPGRFNSHLIIASLRNL